MLKTNSTYGEALTQKLYSFSHFGILLLFLLYHHGRSRPESENPKNLKNRVEKMLNIHTAENVQNCFKKIASGGGGRHALPSPLPQLQKLFNS